MVMTHTQAKNPVQRLVGSNDRVETNRWTDGQTDTTYRITFPANAIGN